MNYKKEVRFVVTNQCNFDCIFCHNEGMHKKDLDKIDSINPEDFKFVTETLERCLDIKKFVFTGGEPLLRNDIIEISRAVKNESNKINLITNGVFLKNKQTISDYVDEIHVSLGTLDKAKHEFRTGTQNQLSKVLEGINLILETNVSIKLNIAMIMSENHNLDNLIAIIEYAKKINKEIYLIEIYPRTSVHHMSFDAIEKTVYSLGYKRGAEQGLKVLFNKPGYPNLYLTFIPCAFVNSPLVDDATAFCKQNQSIYIMPDFTIQTCFEKNEERISIKEDVKNKDEGALIKKIKLARAKIGKDCPLIKY
jgi:cyclic pyranopterin phosphate synthase